MKTLRTKLFLWYLASLLVLSSFFYVVVHILMLPNALEYFFILLLILAAAGFAVIYQINSLLNRLQAALNRERQFIADVAHELKTPLATLRASLELAKMPDALVEVDRLSGTIKDILELAWSEAPATEKQNKEFDLSALLEEIAEIADKLGTTKNITVEATIDRNIRVSGFREKLARAILNIVDNAVKYTPAQGKITISLEKLDGRALVIVSDTGQGIAKDELPHIFDRFYRGAKTDKIFGSGLGLAISKSIIKLHGGEIKVKSRPGHGSTFAIVLPAS